MTFQLCFLSERLSTQSIGSHDRTKVGIKGRSTQVLLASINLRAVSGWPCVQQLAALISSLLCKSWDGSSFHSNLESSEARKGMDLLLSSHSHDL